MTDFQPPGAENLGAETDLWKIESRLPHDYLVEQALHSKEVFEGLVGTAEENPLPWLGLFAEGITDWGLQTATDENVVSEFRMVAIADLTIGETNPDWNKVLAS